EAGPHGVGVDQEDFSPPPEDVLVDPGLAPCRRDLLGVEPGDVRRDLREELQEAGRKLGGAGVAEEDEDLLAPGKCPADPLDEPGLLGSLPGGGKGPAGGDQLGAQLLGIADLEEREVAGSPVEIGGELDERPQEPAGPVLVEAVGPDAGQELLLE